MNKKTISIFGSTGSIGCNSVEIIKNNIEDFEVVALVAFSNIDLLFKQAMDLKPQMVCIIDESKFFNLKERLKLSGIKVLAGQDALIEIAKIKVDVLMMAIVGAAGIIPAVTAIKSGSNIAMANKESLVCAGHLLNSLAIEHKVKIIPVDSEHSGLFQIFDFERVDLITHITLTASGGPFLKYTEQEMKTINKKAALNHPTWQMGAKNSIDSASMVNKCLEVIEAIQLFPLASNQINIVIHPESIIHALVHYQDGSILAQLSERSMQIPISYALYYPLRARLNNFNKFDLVKIGNLSFFSADENKFHSLRLLKQILQTIDTNSSLVFNMANEVAVEAFLNEKISFNMICEVIEQMLNKIPVKNIANFKNVEDLIDELNMIVRETKEYIICLKD